MRFVYFNDYEVINRERLKLFAKYAKGIVLDVGAAQLPNKFFDYSTKVKEVWMVDIKEAKVRLPEKYKKVIFFDLDSGRRLPFEDGSIDTIVLGEILEHLRFPLRILKECSRILKPNGILLISTPTPKYYLERIYYAVFREHLCPAEHKVLFTRNQMKTTLVKHGFILKKVIGYSFWVPLLKIGFVQTRYKMAELFTWQQIYVAKKAS
ncbi:MAG: class I SAM-dependent methyltransferase [Candidatus Jordarchaeales archaeon]